MPFIERLATKEINMDTRYEDPTIAQINYYWRDRQNMYRADTKLVLQIKAMCRSYPRR